QDGDGIYDFWETEGWGIDVNSDSLIDLDLYARGARPDHKDLFIEVDAMLSFGPDFGALGDVEQVFNAAPVSNPDGTSGIHLHVRNEVSDLDIPDASWNTGDWPAAQFDAIKKVYFGTNREKGNPQALQAKSLVYRYCLCINKFDGGTSGVAHIGNAVGSAGNDFIVSLGAWAPAGGNRHDFAGTFMHELGHTLGLLHGGADNILFKPNYYSVMNYTFQVEQSVNNPQLAAGSWRLWYSPYALNPLDENRLDESKGLSPPLVGNPPRRIFPKVLIPYSRPDGKLANAVLAEGTAVDWDGNGDSSGVSPRQFDLTHIDPANFNAQPVQVLNSFDDWSNLKLGFRTSPNYQPFSRTAAPAPFRKIAAGDTVKEMDLLMRNRLRALPPYGIIEPLDDWSHDAASPIIISRDPYSQRYPLSVADTQGGAYIVWQDFHYPGNDKRMVTKDHMRLYVQHIDAFGQQVWPGALAVVAQGPGDQMLQNIIPDGFGGVIIIWGEQNCEISGCWQNVFAQRINDLGYYRANHDPRVWGEAGVM
ncbi:MAG: hypothetical protein WCP55_24390, partial [Lentisphaerota bacterium]